MRNAILYHLLVGTVWFGCATLFAAAAVADGAGLFDLRPRLARTVRFLLVTAIALAFVSGTPAALWLAVPMTVAASVFAFWGFGNANLRVRRWSAGAAGAAALLAIVGELPHHIAAPPDSPRPARLWVIGDSLTSGGFGEDRPYPALLADRTGIEVRSLAYPADTAGAALRRQAPTVVREGRPGDWVLVAVGGNDMLGGTDADRFAADLDALLTAARGDPSAPRTVLMLELPALPAKWAFARHQRRLASLHGVVLIPKRVLLGVVLTDENVIDGLHLSQAGHEAMSRELETWLGR